MKHKLLKLKHDKFRKSRGGYSRLLRLVCEKCEAPLFMYQKDGAGTLKRLYFDRIISEPYQVVRGKNDLVCAKCKTLIGIRMMYKKEKRPAYRLFAGAVVKE